LIKEGLRIESGEGLKTPLQIVVLSDPIEHLRATEGLDEAGS